jgi:hypothetical protein
VTGAVFAAAFLGIVTGSQQDGAIGAIVILAFTAAVVLGWTWLSAMQLQLTKEVAAMKFHTTLLQSGKTAVGIQVPNEVVEALGAGKRPPVRVTINGYTYRNTIAVMGGVFMVGVSAENREKAQVAGGDEVDVDIELDTQPRELTLPPDFSVILDREPAARRFFDSLSRSRQQALVLPVVQAKTPETRQRRIDKALMALREGRAQ